MPSTPFKLGDPTVWPWLLQPGQPVAMGFVLLHVQGETYFQPLVYYTYICIWLTFNVQQSSRIRDHFLLFPHWLKSYNHLLKMSQGMMNTHCHHSVTTNPSCMAFAIPTHCGGSVDRKASLSPSLEFSIPSYNSQLPWAAFNPEL